MNMQRLRYYDQLTIVPLYDSFNHSKRVGVGFDKAPKEAPPGPAGARREEFERPDLHAGASVGDNPPLVLLRKPGSLA